MATRNNEIVALLKPSLDAHTLGINAIEDILLGCGFHVHRGTEKIHAGLHHLQQEKNRQELVEWLIAQNITRLGISYRLDPQKAVQIMGYLIKALLDHNLLYTQGGRIRALYFAGLPLACQLLEREYRDLVITFSGGESLSDLIQKMGIDPESVPSDLKTGNSYDTMRLELGKKIIDSQVYQGFKPLERPVYKEYGTSKDTLCYRLARRKNPFFPLIRAHAGPYSSELTREKAVEEFNLWVTHLAQTGYLDILSIGTSQLSQSNFGEDWRDRANGGGVPINSREEYQNIWESARPLLVRTYAGTKHIPQLAIMYEETINMAWHALSLWWFNQLDGRGPYDLYTNLQQHQGALRCIASSNKPFEPNVAHHFAFRGADDVTCVLALWLSAKLAKKMGIKTLVLQLMLNTPRYIAGITDLVKARAAQSLLGELVDKNFQIILQPRAGIDYFHTDLNTAKRQLAAVTALMDDIEARHNYSPPIIHVVSYSEASHLATPSIINESIQITQQTLIEYRQLKHQNKVPDMDSNQLIQEKRDELLEEVKTLIKFIEDHIPNPYSAEGLYQIFAAGFLPTPHLWQCTDEFKYAVTFKTKFLHGGIRVVDENNKPLRAQKIGEYGLSNLDFAREWLIQRQKQSGQTLHSSF